MDAVFGPIVKALLGRRWETAALSRWTGVISTLKRMLLGTLWNKTVSYPHLTLPTIHSA